jgi:hypothetical protein
VNVAQELHYLQRNTWRGRRSTRMLLLMLMLMLMMLLLLLMLSAMFRMANTA